MQNWFLVSGAVGGVGATTVAANIAVAAAKAGRQVCLIDGHFGSGGLEVVLGVEQVHGLRWSDFSLAQGAINMDSVLPALITWQSVAVLSAQRTAPFPPAQEALTAILGSIDEDTTVVLDAPPAWAAFLPQPARALGLVVAGRTLASVAGAIAAKTLLGRFGVSSALAVTSHLRCALTPARVAATAGLPLWADIRKDNRIGQAIELGAGPLVGLSRAGRDLNLLAQQCLRAGTTS